uniref:Xylanolytic transcriptional activator regulatory domain-containing protein n=1 Tax=Bionectria ochroleuca TaxID=29856 RepID=A0A8H7NLU7_BIOOC
MPKIERRGKYSLVSKGFIPYYVPSTRDPCPQFPFSSSPCYHSKSAWLIFCPTRAYATDCSKRTSTPTKPCTVSYTFPHSRSSTIGIGRASRRQKRSSPSANHPCDRIPLRHQVERSRPRTKRKHSPTYGLRPCPAVAQWPAGEAADRAGHSPGISLTCNDQAPVQEGTRDGWTALSSIVRMAMDMGLQRDPLEFGGAISPYIAEMRRRLWITVANLDYFVSNDCNMPSVLREGDFTTRPPLNVDDSELYPEMTELPPSRAFDQVTDMQIQSYSAMTLGIRLKAASLVRRVDMLTDWTEILEVGSKLERHLEEINAIAPRHGAMTNEAKNARLWKTLILLDGHVRRPLLNLYRPFTLGVPNVPPQILRGYFRSSMALMSIVEELDPTSADYEDINDMSHASLKGDIEQAAFSVCYYIRAAMRQATDSTSLAMQQALRMSPEADDPPHSGGLVLWSLPRLINTTQNVLDFLIKNIKRGDTKDIICLSVVLESVKKPNPHPEEMAYGLRVVLDSCLRSANLSLERLAAAQAETPKENYMALQGRHTRSKL